MRTSANGRAAIRMREGVRLKAYRDSVGVLTIGCGHTTAAGPPTVTAGLTITEAECDAILSRDLTKFEAVINALVKVPLSQNAFDALASFVFNVGGGAFAKSTLLKRLNAGDKAGAADQFLVWNKAGGKTLQGLVNRRRAERKQFLTPDPATTGSPAPSPSPPATVPAAEPPARPALTSEASGPAIAEAEQSFLDRLKALFTAWS